MRHKSVGRKSSVSEMPGSSGCDDSVYSLLRCDAVCSGRRVSGD
jgi:hypothetical protein